MEFEIEHEIKKYLKESELEEPKKSKMPELPEDITVLSSKEIGFLHGRFVKFGIWADYQRVKLEVVVSILTSALDAAYQEALLSKKCQEEFKNVSDRKAFANTRKDVIFLKKRLDVESGKLRYFKVICSGCEKATALLSREITRRGNIEYAEGD